MVCGVFTASLGRLFVEVFQLLGEPQKDFSRRCGGMKRALVVHGCEGLDELSIAGPSQVWELTEDGSIKEYQARDPLENVL